MVVHLTKLGVLMFPITSLEQKFWMPIKNIINGNACFYSYQIEGPGGLTLSHLDQDSVPDGDYDLPLTAKDFMEAYQ